MIDTCDKFDNVFLEIFEQLLKRKLLRKNHASHVFKGMRRIIMKRSSQNLQKTKKTIGVGFIKR